MNILKVHCPRTRFRYGILRNKRAITILLWGALVVVG